MDSLTQFIFFGSILLGIGLRDALKMVLVSALILPLSIVLVLLVDRQDSVLGNLGLSMLWFSASLGGLVAGLLLLIAWSLIGAKAEIPRARSHTHR